ncbi:MAG: hypothetical protein WCS65_10025 [Verrucomicrobiae bacterium]
MISGLNTSRQIRRSGTLLAAAFFCLAGMPALAAVDPSTLPEINLHSGDASRLTVFANLMQQPRGLLMNVPTEWAEARPFDEQGWVKSLPKGGSVWYQPTIQTSEKEHMPGVYVMTWEGKGSVVLNGSSRKQETLLDDKANRRQVVRLPSGQSPLIEITSTDPDGTGDHIRNIKLWPPAKMDGGSGLTKDSDLSPGKVADNLEPAPGQPAPKYHPLFAQHMTSVPFGVYRLMSFNRVNEMDPQALATSSSWDNRRPDLYCSYQYHKGDGWPGLPQNKTSLQNISYEQQIDIANDFGVDIWINIPHLASKEYIESLAKLCAARLKPGRRVWIECSNEMWNGYACYIPQTDFARQAAADHLGVPLASVAGISPQHGWGSGKIQGEMLKTFIDAFTATGQPADRVVKVLAGFTGNAAYNAAMMDSADEIRPGLPDVFAVTHYWGHSAKFADLDYAHPTEAVWKQVFDRLEPYIYEDFNHAGTLAAAKEHHLPIVAYEGSHHVTAGGNSGNPEYVAFLRALQYRKEMGDFHLAQWAWWRAQGLHTAAAFVDVNSNALSFGQWGFKEYVGQTEEDAPKWKALRQWGELQKGVRPIGAPQEAAPAFTTTSLPSPEVGKPYSETITASGGDGPLAITLLGGFLPEGLALTDNGNGTATLAGTPRSLRQSWFTLRVLDQDKDPAYKMFTVIPDPAGASGNVLAAFKGSDIPGGNYGQGQDRRYDFCRPLTNTAERSCLPFGVGASDFWFNKERDASLSPSNPCNLYGGWSLTGANFHSFTSLRDGAFVSWHGTNPPAKGVNPAPSVFDACLVLTKAQFAGQPGRAWFGSQDSECALLAEVAEANGDQPTMRFIVLNGDTWYLSEAVLKKKGTFLLAGFNNSSEPGKRWGVFHPTPDAFAIPDPLPAMEAVDFNDVRAFGLAVRDKKGGYHYLFVLKRLMAIGKSSPASP